MFLSLSFLMDLNCSNLRVKIIFCRDLMNEGIFDIIIDALQSQDKKLVLTG